MIGLRHQRISPPEGLAIRFQALSWATCQQRVVGVCVRHGDHGHLVDWLEVRLSVSSWRACRALRRDMKRVLP
jgi:hypothetical protein